MRSEKKKHCIHSFLNVISFLPLFPCNILLLLHQGPASFGLGSESYEKNLVVEVFGAAGIKKHMGKHMLDACVVYGAEPLALVQAPGREHAKMFPKVRFFFLGATTTLTKV